MWTKEQYQACNSALLINEGACNGLGIAKALDRAYAAFKDNGTDEMNKCGPVILILNQLCHLAGGVFESDDYFKDYFKACDFCQQVVNDYQKDLKIKESVMADAESESLENLQAAADMLDKL